MKTTVTLLAAAAATVPALSQTAPPPCPPGERAVETTMQQQIANIEVGGKATLLGGNVKIPIKMWLTTRKCERDPNPPPPPSPAPKPSPSPAPRYPIPNAAMWGDWLMEIDAATFRATTATLRMEGVDVYDGTLRSITATVYQESPGKWRVASPNLLDYWSSTWGQRVPDRSLEVVVDASPVAYGSSPYSIRQSWGGMGMLSVSGTATVFSGTSSIDVRQEQ